jgi:phosphatidylserine decarboxylase
MLYFYRDPTRTSPAGEGLVLAPADGQVMEVRQVDEPRFLQEEAHKISIFMSLFDVHVNRAPVKGEVALVRHVPGQFLQAFRPESSEVNEHNLVGLNTPYGKVLVKQISGIMARRIVCWVRPGQEVKPGERLGLIKLGSRVDLFLPLDAEPAVQVGDKVVAGKTVIAHW